MRIFTLVLFVVFSWLQYTLWFGKNGIVDFNQVDAEIHVQQQVNGNLQTRNDEMFAEIDDLRQ